MPATHLHIELPQQPLVMVSSSVFPQSDWISRLPFLSTAPYFAQLSKHEASMPRQPRLCKIQLQTPSCPSPTSLLASRRRGTHVFPQTHHVHAPSMESYLSFNSSTKSFLVTSTQVFFSTFKIFVSLTFQVSCCSSHV